MASAPRRCRDAVSSAAFGLMWVATLGEVVAPELEDSTQCSTWSLLRPEVSRPTPWARLQQDTVSHRTIYVASLRTIFAAGSKSTVLLCCFLLELRCFCTSKLARSPYHLFSGPLMLDGNGQTKQISLSINQTRSLPVCRKSQCQPVLIGQSGSREACSFFLESRSRSRRRRGSSSSSSSSIHSGASHDPSA